MIKRMFYALGISILVFVLSEAFNLTLIRDLYNSGQSVMAAVAEQFADCIIDTAVFIMWPTFIVVRMASGTVWSIGGIIPCYILTVTGMTT